MAADDCIPRMRMHVINDTALDALGASKGSGKVVVGQRMGDNLPLPSLSMLLETGSITHHTRVA